MCVAFHCQMPETLFREGELLALLLECRVYGYSQLESLLCCSSPGPCLVFLPPSAPSTVFYHCVLFCFHLPTLLPILLLLGVNSAASSHQGQSKCECVCVCVCVCVYFDWHCAWVLCVCSSWHKHCGCVCVCVCVCFCGYWEGWWGQGNSLYVFGLEFPVTE